MIMIYVGPKSKRYAVHEPLLTQYEWFRKEIIASSDVASPNSITLTAEDPKLFELLISWLYRKKLKAISITDEKMSKEEAALYVDLYLRASVWDIAELQNAIMDRLRARQARSNVLPPRSFEQIFESLNPQSPLRSYIRDRFAHLAVKLSEDRSGQDPIAPSPAVTLKTELYSLGDSNWAFLVDFCVAYFQRLAKSDHSDPDKKTGCVYHNHKAGEGCRL